MKVDIQGNEATITMRREEAEVLCNALTKVMHRGMVLASVRAMLDRALNPEQE